MRPMLTDGVWAEVEVGGAAHSAPVGTAASLVDEEVVDREEIERKTEVCQLGSFSAPIAEHIRLIQPRLSGLVALCLRSPRCCAVKQQGSKGEGSY